MRKGLVALAFAALAGVGWSALASPEPGPWQLKLGAKPSPSLLAVQNTRTQTWLLRASARTLKPLPGPRLRSDGFGSSFSPDGSLIALGDRCSGQVLIVDTRRLSVLGKIAAASEGFLEASAWLGGRLLAVVDRGCRSLSDEGLVLAVLDPGARRILSTQGLAGPRERVHASARTGSLLVLLLGPRWSLGPSRLVTVDAYGLVRSAPLDRIPAGEDFGTEAPGRMSSPGLAVDVAGNRAFVVAGNAPVAEIDLTTHAVSYHELSAPASLVSRVRNWLEPTAAAKTLSSGPTRYARWLGDGQLAIWGSDIHVTESGRETFETAAGVKLIDTRAWSVHALHDGATSLAVADGTLLVFASLWNTAAQKASGIGLTALRADGSPRFHLFGSRPLWVQVVGSRAFVPRGGWTPAYDIVDVRSGRMLRRMPGFMPEPLLP